MRRLRGSLGCLAVVLAAMGGCSDAGPEAPGTAPVGTARRSVLGVGTPELVSDLQPTPTGLVSGSQPEDFVAVGPTRFFTAADSLHGYELWKTDGTPGGTGLVMDIYPGGDSSSIHDLTAAHGVLYFIARSGPASGNTLWRSDGTAAGTGPVFTAPSLQPAVTQLEALDGTLYFTAADAPNGSYQLWSSDGTSAGTHLVKAFPRMTELETLGLRGVGGALYFTADDGVHGREPWKSDGTPGGTVLLKDLAPGPTSSFASGMVAGAGGTLYFLNQGVLWTSNGTAEGTVPLTNSFGGPIVSAGPTLRYLNELTLSGGALFFSASEEDTTLGNELWRSDGTLAGTVRVKDITPSGTSQLSSLRDFNGTLVFRLQQPQAPGQLWTSDGTAEGTVRRTDLEPDGGSTPVRGPFTVAGSRVYFLAERGAWSALWVSDGTAAGTRELRSFQSVGRPFLGSAEGSLLFVADDGASGLEPWKTDGTPEGTVLVRDIHRGTHGIRPRYMMELGDGRVLFWSDAGSGQELWVSDGTAAGTRRLLQGASGLGLVSRRVGGVRYFQVATASWGYNTLWRSDGTPEGTFALREFSRPTSGGTLQVEAELGGRVFFFATTPTEGTELWASDGTREGTVLVKDILPGAGSSNPGQMRTVGGTLYFSAEDGVHGRELWKSDGTAEGTVLVKDLFPGPEGSWPLDKEDLNGTLVFIASDDVPASGGFPSLNKVLWRLGADGHPRKISIPSTRGVPENPEVLRVVHGSLLVFTRFSSEPRLWSYDGTSEQATLLGGFPVVSDVTAAGRVLFFLSSVLHGGRELWRSDGTVAGTYKVGDTNQSTPEDSYFPAQMLGLTDRGQVLLRSWTGPTGLEMWGADGTVGGLSPVADLAPGPSTSDPRSYTRSADSVFFSADDGVHGAELWRLTLPPVPPDTTPPVLRCPVGMSLDATSDAGASASWVGAWVSDDVSASIPLTFSHVSGSTFPVGETVVTATATDAAGNTASCSFRVIVKPSPTRPEEGWGCGAAGSSRAGSWGALLLLAWVALRRPSLRRS